ncbi:amidohydrolase [Zhihengliuella sp.]|uniref:amidohydrolase n=1 Tax=Zhihengliuella sp. TaxID=1954483 RepID=UPI00281140FA|nr:amidohydrolase [Zhihengliuella sp.]
MAGSIYFDGGTVWLGPEHGEADALLVLDGRIAAVGAEARERAHEADRREDLGNGFLLPAFGDGHAHPQFGGLEDVGPAVAGCGSVEEVVAEVRRYAAEHPDAEWITGASYEGSLAPEGLFDARWLDAAVADRPVMLRANDYHTAWCNTRALELAGITAATPEPELGEIPRRPDGSPLGTLREWGAVELVTAVVPPRALGERAAAIDRAADYYLARGVTWVQDAWVEPDDVEAYLELARRDALRLRLNLALYADPRRFDEQLPVMLRSRRAVADAGNPRLTANTVKFFADGVVENQTGALLEPYCSGLHDHGLRVWDPAALDDAVRRVDAHGFQIHIHAIGDAAVRQALDAIEHAVAANGPRDRRPVIAHAQLVDAADMARFAELGVIACMQPLWAQLDALMTVLTVPRLGTERSERQYALRSLLRTGATLSFGSDWPVSSGAPLEGISVAVSRTTEAGDPAGGWTPHEILDVGVALDAYTRAVAFQAFADASDAPWGRIEPGASADLVWLSADPRAVSAPDIARLEVRETYLAGRPAEVRTATH